MNGHYNYVKLQFSTGICSSTCVLLFSEANSLIYVVAYCLSTHRKRDDQ